MKKKYKTKNITRFKKDLKMLLLNLSFTMIYIIQKMLILPKNHLIYLKDSIF